MSTSPAPPVTAPEYCPDIFEQLSKCERLLTAKEVAGMLSISPKTIYSYVERDMIPYYKIEANIRFRARDVAKWLRDRASSRFDTEAGAKAAANPVRRLTGDKMSERSGHEVGAFGPSTYHPRNSRAQSDRRNQPSRRDVGFG
jgi:excisionase family DNA binding protein